MERKINRLQTIITLFVNVLKKIPLAIPLANKQTLLSGFAKFRLRIQSSITAFTNEKTLISNVFTASRLRQRLQICQLSSMTSLQVLVVSFSVCKEQTVINQSIYSNFFASLFAINQN